MSSSSTNHTHSNLPEEELDTVLPTNNNALGLSRRALVGRLLTEKQLSRNAVKEIIYKAWSNYEELHILDKGRNMFLFCFKKEEDAKEVMLKSPWYVMNHLLCLQYWLPKVSVTELDFDRNPFWVQVHNLPLENLNSLSAGTLLAKVGPVMEIEEPIIEGKIVRHFVRGRVQVDVTKPLPIGCWIPRVNLPRLWVFYRYERLLDLCFNCGILGHEQKGCEKPRVMTSFNPYLPKYTHRLSVQASKSVDAIVRGFERKKRRRTDAPQQHQEVRDENTQTEVIHFRSLDKPKEDDFCLEMSRLFTYDDVVERVAQQLGLEDLSKIRLTPHNFYSQQPIPQPIKYRGVEHLSDMLVSYNQTTDILYYEVLDIPLPELQGLKTLKVAFHHATKDEVVIHTIRLPKQSTVGDVLDDLKTKVELSHPEAELRLVELFFHMIYKVFPPNEKIENINNQYWTLRAEETPGEEKNLGSHDRLIAVNHFTKNRTQNQMQIQNFGEPFFLVIHECETLAEIKLRIQKKLQVPDDEFDKWKFAFYSFWHLEYLRDSDIVSSRFQRRDVYGAWEQYLGLEHTDNAPKRSYAANQERLMKEQEEKEHKKKKKAEANLYTIIKVARDEDLAEQIGKDTYFDLVDHDKVRSFCVPKNMSFNNFKEVVAKEFDIQVQFQRFWLWAKRQNHTYRPNRPLTRIEEAQSVIQVRKVSNKVHNVELKLFLEVERGPDLRPITPPEKKKDEILLFFKLYDPEKEELRYVGRLFVNSTSQPSEYLTRLNEMAGYDPDEEIGLYEEIKFKPKVMCEPIDKKLTFRESQLEDGDIICFQKASAMDIEEHIRYPDVPSYLEYVHNRQINR